MNIKKKLWFVPYLWTQTKRYAWAIFGLAALEALRAWLSVRFALATRELIDFASKADSAAFRQSAWNLILIIAGTFGCYVLYNVLAHDTSSKLNWRWKAHLSKILFNGDYQAVSAFHTGELINRMTGDVSIVVSTFVSAFPYFLSLFIRLALSAFVLVQIEPVYTLIIFLAGCGLMIVSSAFRQRLKQMHKDVSEAEGKVSGFYQESLSRLLMIRALDVGDEVCKRGDHLLLMRWKKQRQRRSYSLLGNSVMVLSSYAADLLTTVYCGAKLLSGDISFGTFTAVIQLVAMLKGPVMNISSIVPQYISTVASAERLKELEDLPQEPPVAPKDNALLYQNMQALAASGLSFSYEDRVNVLHNVSFTIPKGSFAVITGDSGSGKSTLLKLLLGVLRPESGECYLQQASNHISLSRDTRGIFAYVPPGNMLLSGTIRDNLLLTRPDATDQELQEALRVSCLEEVIPLLPDGLDTVIGENALGLSDGQAQRVNIARAILSHAPILLLDEATSALDMETEQQVLKRMRSLQNRTCIAVTHRLSALKYADMHLHVHANGEVEIVEQ